MIDTWHLYGAQTEWLDSIRCRFWEMEGNVAMVMQWQQCMKYYNMSFSHINWQIPILPDMTAAGVDTGSF